MILVWTAQSPIGNAKAKETLDTALAFTAYDQSVALLFSDLAVNQLAPQPNAKQAGSKEIAKLIKALPLYDVEAIYLCQQSAETYDVPQQELVVDAKPLDSVGISALIKEATHVIRI